jgi:hypothetical protein
MMKPIKLAKGQAVYVQWRDSCAVSHQWTDEERTKKLVSEDMLVDSVGFVIHNDRRYLGVVSNWDGMTKHMHCAMQMPWACVQKVTIIKGVKHE